MAVRVGVVISFLVLQSRYTREDTPLEELERGTATRRDMSHLVRRTNMIDRCCGVTSADDGHRTGCGTFSQYLDDVIGTFGKGWHLGNPQRTVPDDRLSLCKGAAKPSNARRAAIQD